MVRWPRARKVKDERVISLDESRPPAAPREIVMEPEPEPEPKVEEPPSAEASAPVATAPHDSAPRKWHRA